MRASLFSFVLCLFALSQSFAQTASVDSLVQKLFHSLQTKDEKAYIGIFPSYAQTKNLFRKSVENMKGNMNVPNNHVNVDSLLDEELKMFTEEKYKTEIQGNLKKSFHEVLKQGEEEGLKWSRTQLASYRLDTINEPSANLRSVRGVLYLRDSAREYELFFTDAIYLEDEQKWYGASLNKIARKGEPGNNPADSAPDSGQQTEPARQAKPKAPAPKPKG